MKCVQEKLFCLLWITNSCNTYVKKTNVEHTSSRKREKVKKKQQHEKKCWIFAPLIFIFVRHTACQWVFESLFEHASATFHLFVLPSKVICRHRTFFQQIVIYVNSEIYLIFTYHAREVNERGYKGKRLKISANFHLFWLLLVIYAVSEAHELLLVSWKMKCYLVHCTWKRLTLKLNYHRFIDF